jgi:hypothetical protein
MNDVQLPLIVIGLVALARRIVPRIDGASVAATAIVFATLAAMIATPCELHAALARGVVSGLAAFGAMTAVRYATRRRSTTDEIPPPPPTARSGELGG